MLRPLLASAALAALSAFAPLARGQDAPPSARPTDGQADYVFVLLKSGAPKQPLTPEQVKENSKGHMANIGRLAEERSLVLAGPFGKEGDPKTRGLFVFDVPNVEEARKLTATDPAVQAGSLVFDGYPMRATAALRRIYGLDQEAAATRPAGAPKIVIREYAYLVADDADRAERALAPLASEGKVLLFGRLGGAMAGKAIVVLDAEFARLETILAPVKDALGAHAARPWHATPSLARIQGAPASGAAR